MKTKEIAFTLPLMLALYEFLFFKGGIRRRTICLIPFFLTMLILPLEYINLHIEAGGPSAILSGATNSWGAPSRLDYFFSQFRVIATYIRLLFMPVDQGIYYNDMLYHSFSEPPVFLSFLFLLFIFCFGLYMLLRSRKGEPLLFRSNPASCPSWM
jgi:hypothetical protein